MPAEGRELKPADHRLRADLIEGVTEQLERHTKEKGILTEDELQAKKQVLLGG